MMVVKIFIFFYGLLGAVEVVAQSKCSSSEGSVLPRLINLNIVRQDSRAVSYETALKKALQLPEWKITNTNMINCEMPFQDCACNALKNTIRESSKSTTVIMIVEDLDSTIDYSCPYVAHADSPSVLQIFHAGRKNHELAIVAIDSVAGSLQFQILQKDFPELIKNVLDVLVISFMENPNTLPMLLVFNQTDYPSLLRAHQENIEKEHTPISRSHVWYGVVLIILAIVIGVISIDHDPLVKFETKDTS